MQRLWITSGVIIGLLAFNILNAAPNDNRRPTNVQNQRTNAQANKNTNTRNQATQRNQTNQRQIQNKPKIGKPLALGCKLHR